uniref:Transcription factor CBF/NF-Y/archaeal histone domain-containing protein n=1 Tax=Meloidogyne incognita TaxID=6306 RepID=A0A914L817_MELIC
MNSSSLNAGLVDTTLIPTAAATLEQQQNSSMSALLQQTPPHPPSLQMLQQQTLPFHHHSPSSHLFIQGGNNNNNSSTTTNIYNENNNRNGMSGGNEGTTTLPYNTLDSFGGQQNYNNTFVEATKNALAGMMYQQPQYAGVVVDNKQGQPPNPIVEEDANAAACSSEDGDFRSGRIRKRRYSMARIQPTRIKKVMQSDEEIGRMVASVPVAIGSAMELFAEKLLQSAAGALQHSSTKTLSPVHIKQAILCTPHFAFLEPLLREVPLGTNIAATGRSATMMAATQQQIASQMMAQQIMAAHQQQQQQQFYQQQQESSNTTTTNITSNN